MAGLRSFLSKVLARVEERVDRDPDPDALTGRSSSRRHGLPVVLPVVLQQPDEHQGSTPEAAQAQATLDRIRAEQHRRMRRGTFGRRAGQGSD